MYWHTHASQPPGYRIAHVAPGLRTSPNRFRKARPMWCRADPTTLARRNSLIPGDLRSWDPRQELRVCLRRISRINTTEGSTWDRRALRQLNGYMQMIARNCLAVPAGKR